MKYKMHLKSPSTGKKYLFKGFKVVENDPEWIKNYIFSKREKEEVNTELAWNDVKGKIVEDDYFTMNLPMDGKANSSELVMVSKKGQEIENRFSKFLIDIQKQKNEINAEELWHMEELF